jgi:hypothetical protein
MVSHRDAEERLNDIALVAAFLRGKMGSSAESALGDSQSDYDTLLDMESNSELDKQPRPDDQPKNLRVGCISPYALVEALVGQKMDRCSINASRIISDVLATDYDELFDMKHKSILYAGLKLDAEGNKVQQLTDKELKILNERDLESPDLSRVQKVDDIEKLGLKDILQARVKSARIQNGKLRMVLQARDLSKTVSNCDVTESISQLCLPFRKNRNDWNPPNTSWRDVYQNFFQCMAQRMFLGMDMLGFAERFRRSQHPFLGAGNSLGFGLSSHENTCSVMSHQFDDPIQGALGNSWFVAALFSVFWADPSMINRCIQPMETGNPHHGDQDNNSNTNTQRKLKVKFFDKGGENNNKTETIEVDYRIPVNNSDAQPVYCKSSSGCALWPSLYEKAFAKWVSDSGSDQPDLTQIHSGDPIKAMAQINGRKPEYYFTEKRSGRELVGLVRSCSLNFKTISPMAAYTYPTGRMYRGSNLAANHAYSVLGWTELGQRQHIIIRNPWGVTENSALTSYPGIMHQVEPDFWSPATLLDAGGVLAVEADAFKEYFACIGVARDEHH